MSHEEGGDKPQGTYVPLTEKEVEEWRAHLLSNWQLPLTKQGAAVLCDMAISSLRYAEEIQRLRDTSRSSVVANEGETPRTDEWERNCEFKSVGPGRVDFADPYHALLKFARQLGRELAIANERNDELSRQWSESDQCRAIMQALDGQTSPSATVTPEHLAFYKREELRYAVLRRWLVDEDYCIKGMPQAGTREDVDRLCDAEIAKAEAKRCEYVDGGYK